MLSRCGFVFERDGQLNVLVIDYQYSLKYLAGRVKLYSRLPPEIRGQLLVNYLVFTEIRQKQVIKAAAGMGVRVKVLKANWKY